jgi:hypothetical protein
MSAQNADALLQKLIENPSLKSKLQAGGAAGFEKVANEAGCRVPRKTSRMR